MDSVPPAPDRPRRRRSRRKVLAILVGAAVVFGGFAVWQILRPRTIAEVLSMDPLPLGGNVALQGTITGIGRENTSYGPRLYLELDENTACGTESWSGNLMGDPNASYRIGDSYQMTLRFEAFSLNGDSAIWTPDLTCPFPALHRSIGIVLDAVSQVSGLGFRYNGSDPDGWSRYDITTQGSASSDALPAVLLKALPLQDGEVQPPGEVRIDSAGDWNAASNRFYLSASSALGPNAPDFSIADEMTSLAAATSTNGNMRFVDRDANGLVDSGDRIDVRFPSTGAPNGWVTYLLRVGDWSSSAPSSIKGIRVILVGPEGPLETLPAD